MLPRVPTPCPPNRQLRKAPSGASDSYEHLGAPDSSLAGGQSGAGWQSPAADTIISAGRKSRAFGRCFQTHPPKPYSERFTPRAFPPFSVTLLPSKGRPRPVLAMSSPDAARLYRTAEPASRHGKEHPHLPGKLSSLGHSLPGAAQHRQPKSIVRCDIS